MLDGEKMKKRKINKYEKDLFFWSVKGHGGELVSIEVSKDKALERKNWLDCVYSPYEKNYKSPYKVLRVMISVIKD